jgi:hypothetical protein
MKHETMQDLGIILLTFLLLLRKLRLTLPTKWYLTGDFKCLHPPDFSIR